MHNPLPQPRPHPQTQGSSAESPLPLWERDRVRGLARQREKTSSDAHHSSSVCVCPQRTHRRLPAPDPSPYPSPARGEGDSVGASYIGLDFHSRCSYNVPYPSRQEGRRGSCASARAPVRGSLTSCIRPRKTPLPGGSEATPRRHTRATAHRLDAFSHRVELQVSMLDIPPMKDSPSATRVPLDMGCVARKRTAKAQRRKAARRCFVSCPVRRNLAFTASSRLCAFAFHLPTLFPLDMGSIARICSRRPTSAGILQECRVVSTGRPRPSIH